jgi:hypothetical protein
LVLPVHDINPTRRTPWVTRLLLVVNVVAFVLSPLAVAPLLGEGSPRAICSQVAFFDEYAAKPAEVITTTPRTRWPPVRSARRRTVSRAA